LLLLTVCPSIVIVGPPRCRVGDLARSGRGFGQDLLSLPPGFLDDAGCLGARLD
jgi:hypothetical protein